MELKYDYNGKDVIVDVMKCEHGGGYNIIEYIAESDNEPQIIAGQYPTRRDALMAGGKYVKLITGEKEY